MTRSGVRPTVLALSLAAMLVPAVARGQARRVPPPQARQAVPVTHASHGGSGYVVGARHYSPNYFYRPYNYVFYGSC